MNPVGEVYGWHGHGVGQPLCRFNVTEAEMPVGTQLYTSPPQRTWVGLTDEEIDAVTDSQWAKGVNKPIYAAHRAYARAIEAKLKEKNT